MHHLRQLPRFIALLAIAVLTAGMGTAGAAGTEGFEGFASGQSWPDGSIHGTWRAVYDGYGTTSIQQDGTKVLSLSPKPATQAGETHAGLVTSTQSLGDLDVSVRVRTVSQLRSPAPNPWEVGWVLWHHTDDTHFYYLALKPNGWELGKEDPAYPGAQRFLASGPSPTYPVGAWHRVRVRQSDSTFTVWADGVALTTFSDAQRPYLSGVIGLYSEDAVAHFDDVTW